MRLFSKEGFNWYCDLYILLNSLLCCYKRFFKFKFGGISNLTAKLTSKTNHNDLIRAGYNAEFRIGGSIFFKTYKTLFF